MARETYILIDGYNVIANTDIKNRIDIPYVDKKNTIENFVDKKILEKLERMRRNL